MSCDRVYCRVQSGGTDTFVCNCLCHKPKEDLLEQLQQPETQEQLAAAFSATSQELGQAAVDEVQEITRCNHCLDHLVGGGCPKKFSPCKEG